MSNITTIPGVTLRSEDSGWGGTSFQGYLGASYAQLVGVLGESTHGASGDGKVSTEWALTFEGEPFTVYDYKETNLYDADCPSVEEFRRMESYAWHIGGKGDPERTKRFIAALRAALPR